MDKSPDAFRTISEVADMLDTPAHVLRFWESRFAQVRPVKRAGGRRYYRPTDVALLAGIRALLHDQGVTIRGVQKILRERGVRQVSQIGTAVLSGLPVPHIAVPQEDLADAHQAGTVPPDADAPEQEPPDDEPPERALQDAERQDGAQAEGAGVAPPGPAPVLPAAAVAARRQPPDGGAVIHDLFARLARADPPDAPSAPAEPAATPPDGLTKAAAETPGTGEAPKPGGRGAVAPDADGMAALPDAPMASAADQPAVTPAPPPKDPAPEVLPLAVRLRALPPGALGDRVTDVQVLATRLAALRARIAGG